MSLREKVEELVAREDGMLVYLGGGLRLTERQWWIRRLYSILNETREEEDDGPDIFFTEAEARAYAERLGVPYIPSDPEEVMHNDDTKERVRPVSRGPDVATGERLDEIRRLLAQMASLHAQSSSILSDVCGALSEYVLRSPEPSPETGREQTINAINDDALVEEVARWLWGEFGYPIPWSEPKTGITYRLKARRLLTETGTLPEQGK